MATWIRTCFWSLAGWLASWRYRVRVVGLEKLRGLRGPTLVMPNHPGYMDPPLVLGNLPIKGGIRPLVFSGMYHKPILYPLMRLAGSVPMPDLSEHSRSAREQTLTTIDTLVAGIQRGENFLIYPSGHAQRRGLEEIGGARAASEVLERCPEANLVLVRTRGLWGSMFSYAQTGESPHLGRCALRGIGWMIANLLFFAPRRDVTMTVEVIDRRDLPDLSRKTLNRYLEDWYNREGAETPTFVPYHPFLGPRHYVYPSVAKVERIELDKIKPATIKAVNDLVEEHLGHPLDSDQQQADMALDRIGLDSLDRMDIALKIEDRFGFQSDHVAETLGELWALAAGQLTGGGERPPPVPQSWHRHQY